MSTATPKLDLSLLAAGQAAKHVTLNEALLDLDLLTQIGVLRRDLAAPPASPAEGDAYIVAAPASGGWSGRENAVALWRDGAWRIKRAARGFVAYVAAEDRMALFDGAAWRLLPVALTQTDRLGVNATADATTRLAVSAAASLLNRAGQHHRLTINKNAAGDTASAIFATAFSGRAEIGLAGDDRLRIKTSADGAAWSEAVVIDGAGKVGVGTAAPTTPLHVAGAVRIGPYAVAALPSAAASGAGSLVYVANEAGGPVVAFSDGAAWRRVTDRAVVA